MRRARASGAACSCGGACWARWARCCCCAAAPTLPPPRRSTHPTTSLQIFLLLAVILAFFLITTGVSAHVKLGLYSRYLRAHRGVFGLAGAALTLIGAVAAYRMSLANAGLPYDQLWGRAGYLALWAVQRIALLLLQCGVVHATAGAFRDAERDGLSAAAISLMAAARRL